MPAGQTPHTVVLFAHNDLVDKVQPGDRVHVTGEGSTVRPLTWSGAHDLGLLFSVPASDLQCGAFPDSRLSSCYCPK